MATTSTTPAPPESAAGLPTGPKLNLGCGPVQPAGWVNVDGSNRAWLASRLWFIDRPLVKLGLLPPTEFGPQVTIHNLFNRLPYRDNSVGCVYAGELWEHFEYPDAARLTAECFRVLAPGGVLRVGVPDGPAFWRQYLAVHDREMAKPPAERSTKTLHDLTALFFRDICTRPLWLGSMGHKHKWQFDEPQLTELFRNAGFTSVERMPFHKSRIPDVALAERSNYLIVEGVKPGPGTG